MYDNKGVCTEGWCWCVLLLVVVRQIHDDVTIHVKIVCAFVNCDEHKLFLVFHLRPLLFFSRVSVFCLHARHCRSITIIIAAFCPDVIVASWPVFRRHFFAIDQEVDLTLDLCLTTDRLRASSTKYSLLNIPDKMINFQKNEILKF